MTQNWECPPGTHRWIKIGLTAGGSTVIEKCERCATERRRQLDGDEDRDGER